MTARNAAKDASLLDATEQAPPNGEALPARIAVDTPMLPMIERLAALPDFDVAKLEKLLDMQERILDRNAEAAFNAAFAEMQAEIPEIDEHGRILVDGVLRSRYAKFEDIQKIIKPILKRFGFSLAFETQHLPEKTVRVVGILTHREGHSRRSEFVAPADKTGSKNDVQALGSSTQYGRRYTTCDLLNISTRGLDDDGEGSERPQAPEGFDAFWGVLEGLAKNGIQELTQAFNRGSTEFKNYVVRHRKTEWATLKTQAQKASADRRRS